GLRVNIGHFGGDSTCGSDESWSARFVDVMAKGEFVYADLGYRTGLRSADSPASCELARLMKRELPHGMHVRDRLMYGSDWHMLSKESRWPAYAGELAATLGDAGGAAAVQAVFGDNVMRCFGLHPRGANRKRLEAFHARHSLAPPAWASP
ncbi:MAG: amidohydrolase family protein, partial [Usitatibacter sp.]